MTTMNEPAAAIETLAREMTRTLVMDFVQAERHVRAVTDYAERRW